MERRVGALCLHVSWSAVSKDRMGSSDRGKNRMGFGLLVVFFVFFPLVLVTLLRALLLDRQVHR